MITLLLFLLAEPNVDSLIGQLGDDNYAVRESASSQLLSLADQMPPKTILPKLREARRHTDFEIRWRSEQVIQKHYANVIKNFSVTPPLLETSSVKQWPWIDCLPKDYPGRSKILETIYRPYQDDTGEFIEIESITVVENKLRQATRDLVLSLLDQDKDRQEIMALVETMVANEKFVSTLTLKDALNITQCRRWQIRYVSDVGYFHQEYSLKPINPDDFPKR